MALLSNTDKAIMELISNRLARMSDLLKERMRESRNDDLVGLLEKIDDLQKDIEKDLRQDRP